MPQDLSVVGQQRHNQSVTTINSIKHDSSEKSSPYLRPTGERTKIPLPLIPTSACCCQMGKLFYARNIVEAKAILENFEKQKSAGKHLFVVLSSQSLKTNTNVWLGI